MREPDSLPVELVKAALLAVMSALPIFLLLYSEEPRVRWAVDEWVGVHLYRARLWEWRRRWRLLPGWRQELWNHEQAPPPELREVHAPAWLDKLGRG